MRSEVSRVESQRSHGDVYFGEILLRNGNRGRTVFGQATGRVFGNEGIAFKKWRVRDSTWGLIMLLLSSDNKKL